jgi:hypothetical protein
MLDDVVRVAKLVTAPQPGSDPESVEQTKRAMTCSGWGDRYATCELLAVRSGLCWSCDRKRRIDEATMRTGTVAP